VGGITSDAFLGPFRVLIIGSMGVLIGTLCLIGSELFSVYLSLIQVPVAMLGISLFFLGNGFLKPCLSAFLGDQFDPENETEIRSRWFSWFYLTIQFGSLGFSIATPLTLQYLKPWVTFVILLLPLLLGISFFVIPHTSYKKRKQGGNVFTTFILILVLGCCGSRDRHQRHWLDKTKSRFSEQEVEDAKVALQVLTIMVPLPFFWMIFFQMYSIWIHQSEKMDLKIGDFTIPALETASLNGLLDILLIPLFEKVIYPLFEHPMIKNHFNFTPLKRMAAGHLFTIAALIVAGFVSKIAEENPYQLHVVWIIPQYFLISCAEILLSITGLGFAYKEAPEPMKGTMTAVYLFTTAIGNVLILAFELVLGDLELWIRDFSLAGMIFLIFIVFTGISIRYTYKSEY